MGVKKKICILMLVLSMCFIFIDFGLAVQQYSLTLVNSGTIAPAKRAYVCGNYNSTHYYAQNNVTGLYEFISSDSGQTIAYALSKLTAGRTSQETVLLKGNFLIGTTITMSQGYVLLDCRQATLTVTASTTAFDVKVSNVNFLGGHWIGAADGVSLTAIRFYGNSVTNCLVDGMEANNFNSNAAGGFGPIYCAYGSSYITIQNCKLHDNTNSYGLSLQGSGYDKVINCTIYNDRSGMYVDSGAMYNKVIGCEFHDNGNPDIYLDGISNGGNNTITGCKFHKESTGSGGSINIKCPYNTIYNNTFYNYLSSASVCFSIYSQYSGAHADNNNIYNNTFTNCYYTFWIGGNPSSANPELGNKIHDNTFTSCTYPILLNFQSSTAISDTWIYYNTFISCTNFLAVQGSTNVANTVVAYNTINPAATDHAFETSYTNTMVYGNTGLGDYNVPTPLPIPAP